MNASSVCRSLHSNTSLISLTTNDEFDFIVNKLLKRRINQAFIGLQAFGVNNWTWLDGRTFWNQIFGPIFVEYRRDTSLCGIIHLVNGKKPAAIEGRDCTNDEAYFVCKYGM